jgi:hypothetical protein
MCSRAITSEEEPSLAMPSSFYMANGGTGNFTKTTQPSFFGRNIISAQRWFLLGLANLSLSTTTTSSLARGDD